MKTSVINFFLVNVDFVRDITSQYSLLVMTEKLNESIDKGNASGALLTDCIDHTVLIAKPSAFRLSPLSLKLIYSYLSNRISMETLVIELILDLVYSRVLF